MTTQLQNLPDPESVTSHISMLISKPGRTIWIAVSGRASTPILTPHTVNLMERWLLDDHRANVQILTSYDHGVLRDTPHLRTLGEHLPSRVAMRVLDPDAETFVGEFRLHGEWLLTESGGALYRQSVDTTAWSGAIYAPGAMRRLQREHARLWENALPSSELRSMHI